MVVVGGWVLCLFVVSLTCKSFVRLGERGESHSWFPPQFLSG